MNYEWDFGAVWSRMDMLLAGFAGTVSIAAVAIVLGVLLGLALTAMRLSGRRPLAIAALAFTEFYRNTPAVVHFFWIYYALPVLVAVRLGPFEAAVIALSAQSAAFYAEVFRGGVLSVEKGQWEGARALGMTGRQVLRRVIVPQAARRMVAPFVERSFELFKTTSLASTLAYGELLYQGMQVNSITFRPIEVYTTIAAMYLLFLALMSFLARQAEARLSYSQ